MYTIVYNNKYYYVTESDTIMPSGSFIPLNTYPTVEEAEKGVRMMTKWHFYRVTVKNVNTGEEIPYFNSVRVKKKTTPATVPTILQQHTVTSFDDIIVGFNN